jgi:hypothetical protein
MEKEGLDNSDDPQPYIRCRQGSSYKPQALETRRQTLTVIPLGIRITGGQFAQEIGRRTGSDLTNVTPFPCEGVPASSCSAFYLNRQGSGAVR